MPTIHLKPIQTGDACYLQDHHNRDGECIITITMMDGRDSWHTARCAIIEHDEPRLPAGVEYDDADLDACAQWCAEQWCTEQWQLAQADVWAETDRDTEGDDSERYLECHILATWEV